ncbi:hypothetical protein A8135_09130 [Legionella jamestowniensis]|uniref:Type-IV pilin n=1 Tax=Legionella jamestowniensis TaxID=455 RepID=A0ABX2Y3T9_9GAMM|nr:type IV pilin protein [Legionella jamestowniensis]OCH98915.1 hypothetical protein A8135_09130 [Legionella jamestowniensis]
MLNKGFTLFESLLVLFLLAIFTCLGYPSYLSHLQHARRYDGQTALLDLANRMEHFYAENHTYETATLATGQTTDIKETNLSNEKWYRLKIMSQTPHGFILHAIPRDAQSNDKACQTLSLDQAGVKGISAGPINKPTATVIKCWQ